VHRITSTLFSNQSGNWATRLQNQAEVKLTLGADQRDDCAVYRFSGDLELVAGSDYVRGPKFRLYELGYMNEYDLGFYLAAANISDIAAMGAVPIGLLSVVRYTSDMSDKAFESVLRGIRDACQRSGVLNVGGDIGTAERLILSASAMGVCEPGTALTRHGASAGDLVAISGRTGIAGAAMFYFSQKQQQGWSLGSDDEGTLLAAWKRPFAEVDLGRVLASFRIASACQDSSDGLKASIEQVAAASSVGITLNEAAVPIDPVIERLADLANLDPLIFVFGNSVDFRLVYTVPPSREDELRNLVPPNKFQVIGSVNNGGETLLRHKEGGLSPIPGVAWRHQPDPLPKPDGPSPDRSN
jgi:thiamine-monophosphate kinase